MNRLIAAAAVLVMTASPALAKGDPCADGEAALAERSAEIQALYDASEEDRARRTSTATDVLERDADRAKQIRKMDKKGLLCTPDDKWHAAWLLLASDEVDDIERAYELAKQTMEARHARGPWMVAYSFDRWRIARGYNQSYGTQTRPLNGKRCLITVESDVTDEDRAKYQVPALPEVYRRLLDAHGYEDDEATFDRMKRRGLTCPPVAWDGSKRIVAPE